MASFTDEFVTRYPAPFPFSHLKINIRPSDISRVAEILDTDDKKAYVQSVQMITFPVSVCDVVVKSDDEAPLLQPGFFGLIEAIWASEGEFEFFTEKTAIDPKADPAELVCWGKSTNSEMWFTDDARCVNRRFLDSTHEKASADGILHSDGWLNEVFDATRNKVYLKFIGERPKNVLQFVTRIRKHLRPAELASGPRYS